MNLQSILLLAVIVLLAFWAWRQSNRHGRGGGCHGCHGCRHAGHCTQRSFSGTAEN